MDMERDLWWWEVEMGMGSEGLTLSRVLGEDMVAVIVKTGNPAVLPLYITSWSGIST